MNSTQITAIIVIVFIVVIVGAYFSLMNTPLGKAVNSIFGGIAGVLAAVNAQLKTCDAVGYFNVSKGCWIGVLGVGVAVLYALAQVGSIIFAYRGNSFTLTQASAEQGKSIAEIAKDVGTKLGETSRDMDPNLSEQEQELVLQKAGINEIANSTVKSIQSQTLSPQEKASKILEIRSNIEVDTAKINENVSEEIAESTDVIADEMIPVEF